MVVGIFPRANSKKIKKVEEYKFISRISSSFWNYNFLDWCIYIYSQDNSGIQYLLLMAGYIFVMVVLITEIRYRRIINDQDGVIFTHSGMYYKGDIYIWDRISKLKVY